MSKSKRLVELMMTVNTKRKFTLRELAEEFGVSTRTMSRDLLELQELGVPLYAEVGAAGGYRVLKERILPPIAFREEEAAAMFFAYQSLQHYDTLPFDAEAESALKKFYHYLPADVKAKIDGMRERIVFWVSNRGMPAPYLKEMLEAAIAQQIVTITYDSPTDPKERDVQPLGVYSENGFWYCPAYCFSRQAFRLFRVDRIHSVRQTEDQTRRRDFSGFKITDWFQPPETLLKEGLELKVELTRTGTRGAATYPWAQITRREDGTGMLEGRIKKEDMDYFAGVFLGMANDAKVVSPAALITLMRERISELSAMYGS